MQLQVKRMAGYHAETVPVLEHYKPKVSKADVFCIKNEEFCI